MPTASVRTPSKRKPHKRRSQWLIEVRLPTEEVRLPTEEASWILQFTSKQRRLTWNKFFAKHVRVNEKIARIKKDSSDWMLCAQKPERLRNYWSFDDKVMDFLKSFKRSGEVCIVLIAKPRSAMDLRMDSEDEPQVDYYEQVDLKPFVHEPDSSIIITATKSLAQLTSTQSVNENDEGDGTSQSEMGKSVSSSWNTHSSGLLSQTGIPITQPECIKWLLAQVPSGMMQDMAKEINQLLRHDKSEWMKVVTNIPITSQALFLMFGNVPNPKTNTFGNKK